MEHATTYDTAKLKQAPGMVVHCERGHQLQRYVYHLHLLTLHVTSLVLVCSRLALHVCIMFNFSNELEMGIVQTLALKEFTRFT